MAIVAPGFRPDAAEVDGGATAPKDKRVRTLQREKQTLTKILERIKLEADFDALRHKVDQTPR